MTSFSGKASADVIQASFSIPNFLIISNFFQGPGPSSQASIDSLGTSQAFASLPYPGETATSIPGLAATLTGKSLPSYPFIVNSDYPSDPHRQIDQPGYHLSATSTATSSTGMASAGESLTAPSEVGGFAKAAVANSEDGFVATATAHTDLNLGGISVTGVMATAEVRRSASGSVTKTSALAIGGLSIGGVAISVDKDGLSLIGTKVPLPSGSAVQQLSVGGTTVTYLQPSMTGDSVLSPGLQIATSMVLPAPVRAPARIVLTIGRAFAQGGGVSSGGVIGGLLPVGLGGSPGSPGSSGTLPVQGGASSGGVAPFGGGQSGTFSTAAAPPPAIAGATQSSPVGFLPAARALPRLSLYPILALAAAVLLLASLNSRRLTKAGPRWNS